jgi:hypothetical protein
MNADATLPDRDVIVADFTRAGEDDAPPATPPPLPPAMPPPAPAPGP